MIKHIPDTICERIYDILVKHAGAPEQYRYAFMHNYSNPDSDYKPIEFRGCSKWGMAGKFWWNNDRFYVSGRSRGECSSDHEHGIEQSQCEKVNELLTPLYDEFRDTMLPIFPIERIPKLPQYQGALDDQLRTLVAVANRLGLQDAADFVRNITNRKN